MLLADGTVVPDGTAVCYTMPLKNEQGKGRSEFRMMRAAVI